jgi:hypothetical protein
MDQAPLTRPLQVRLTEADLRYLDELARRNERSRLAQLRFLVKEKRMTSGDSAPVSLMSQGAK